MTDPRLTVLPDHDALADAAAECFVAVVAAAIDARGAAAVALAGGQTPRAMNARLATAPRRAEIDWARVTFYFGDERCVPPEHADSNYRMTRETLFDPLGISTAQVHRMHGEDPAPAAADAYEQVLRGSLGELPTFDLVMLGMGPDGHTASLFPGTLGGIDMQRLAVANFVPKFDAFRLTLTPRAINAARAVTITAAAAEKADALAGVLSRVREPERYPVQLIAPASGDLRWLVDAAAASKLDGNV